MAAPQAMSASLQGGMSLPVMHSAFMPTTRLTKECQLVDRRPSPALAINLSSNNPFRRAVSPGRASPMTSPRMINNNLAVSSSQSTRPSSTNPFLDSYKVEAPSVFIPAPRSQSPVRSRPLTASNRQPTSNSNNAELLVGIFLIFILSVLLTLSRMASPSPINHYHLDRRHCQRKVIAQNVHKTLVSMSSPINNIPNKTFLTFLPLLPIPKIEDHDVIRKHRSWTSKTKIVREGNEDIENVMGRVQKMENHESVQLDRKDQTNGLT